MGKTKNKKRKNLKSTKLTFLGKIKAFIISLLLCSLAAVGLWRCLNDDGQDVALPFERSNKDTSVDAGRNPGKDREEDPTLINEQEILKQEVSKQSTQSEREAEKEAIESKKNDRQVETQKKSFPNYAVAFQFHTQVFSKPAAGARVIGYSRRGAKFRVSERISTDGCKKGWYEAHPGGLFVCNGLGVIVSNEPVDFSPSPTPANLEASIPYKYVFVTAENTPQYLRPPTVEEVASVTDLFQQIQKKEEVENTKIPLAEGDLKAALQRAREIARRDSTGDIDGEQAQKSASKNSSLGAEVKSEDSADSGATDPFALPSFVYQRMKKGYYVSAEAKTNEESGTYVRTVRGRYIPSDRIAPAKPSLFEGLLIKGQKNLPRVFNVGTGVNLLRQKSANGELSQDAPIDHLLSFPFFGKITRKGRSYVQVGEDIFLSSRVATIADKINPPVDLAPHERWIDINLTTQTLVAYEGYEPVFATLVSSGKEDFETPEGTFRIYSKHVSITMDDPLGGEEAYSIEDVPWTQYFKDSYALHAAFWHDKYGRVHSHGCINLAPADARRLFFWTSPVLPEGLHSIASNADNPGTRVVIHK